MFQDGLACWIRFAGLGDGFAQGRFGVDGGLLVQDALLAGLGDGGEQVAKFGEDSGLGGRSARWAGIK